MNKQPKISIITPSFNCAPYIRTCVESVLAQNYPNFEHIIVDGASQDGTVEILKQYPHLRWISEPDNGEAEALNKALRMVQGDIVGWLNADDSYFGNVFHRIAEEINPRQERHVVYGKTLIINETEDYYGLRVPIAPVTLPALMQWFHHLHLYQPSMFYSRELVNAVGFYREDLYFSIDYDYWLRIAAQGYHFFYIDQVLARARLWRSDAKSAHPRAEQEKNWMEICLNFRDHLSSSEQINFWKDYYSYQLRNLQNESMSIPDDQYALIGLSLALQDIGRIQDGLAVVNHFVARYPDSADAYWLLGEALYLGGQTDQAKAAFEQALALEPHYRATAEKSTTIQTVKALVFFPSNPYPPRNGAHQRCLAMLRALRDLDCEVTLFSSTLFTDTPWQAQSVHDLQNALGVKVQVYEGTHADQQFIAKVSAGGWGLENRALYAPAGLRESFRRCFRELQPHILVMNYASYEQLANGDEFASAVKVMETHDLVSLNIKMRQAIEQHLMASNSSGQIDPRLVKENFFSALNLDASPEEYQIYDRYDYTIAISPREAQIIQAHAPNTRVLYIPMVPDVKHVPNSYAGLPLFLVGSNPFNVQGYLYFVMKVLPGVLRRTPEFVLRVAGDGCRQLPPVTGVQLSGFVPDLGSLYAESPFAVCPLIGGTGQQVKIVEAMAHGVPVIALRNVAESSPIKHGANGFIAENAGEFAEYTVQLFRDRDLCRRLGQAARETIAEISSGNVFVENLKPVIDEAQARASQTHTAQRRVADSYPTDQPGVAPPGEQTPPLHWHAPIFDPSGYADEARHLIRHVSKRWPVRIQPIARTSEAFLAQMDVAEREALFRLMGTPLTGDYIHLVHAPAYAFQRDPNAFYNVGRTVFETDRLPSDWVVRCNAMDEVWVPTAFNVETFRNAGVTAPLHVVPEGVDATFFRPGVSPLPIPDRRSFAFLSIFEWIHRKGWDILLRAWVEAFTPDDDVCLVLRTYPPNATDAPNAQAEIEARINRFLEHELGRSRDEVAPIIVLGAQVPQPDMPRLYAAADAYAMPARGEGWGRPYIEAMACGLPVIGPRWGGNLAFMNDENAYLIDIEGLVEVDDRMEFPFYHGHKWAQPSVEHLTELMRHVYDHPDTARAKGRRARRDMVENWTWDHAARLALQRLEAISDQLSVISHQSSAHQPPSHPAPQSSSPPAIQPPMPMQSSSQPAIQLSAVRNMQYAIRGTQSAICNLQSAIRWEGSQFVTHSLALVNRELCIRLAQDPDIDLSIIPYEPHQFGPDADPRFEHIVRHLNRPLSRPADVHVRHQWPPNFTPPPEGHWVIMQPWEFGSIPKRWIETMREQVDDVWVYTNYVRECYIRSGMPANRVHVIPLGVDATRFRPEAPPLTLKTHKRFKFLFVGGTISRKGIDILLDAYVTAFTAADDVCLVIKDMGGQSFYKGQTAQDMIARCRHTPDAPEIEYIDRTLSEEDLAGLYTACDCLVHPYRGEGFGLPIAEAMSSGRPVIVTGHGAALDFCTSETAYLIPAREVRLPQKRIGDLETVDYPWWADPDCEALQQLMRHVVANPAEARAKGQAARACIQANFTWDRAAEAVRQRMAALCQQPIRRFASVDAGDGHLGAAEQALTELFAAGQAALDRDDLETAAREFARVTGQFPDLAAGHTALGSTLMALGRMEEAIPALRRATELVPQEPALHNQLGIALYQLGELEAAEKAFQAALRVAPADPSMGPSTSPGPDQASGGSSGHRVDALLNLIEIYRAQDRYVEATECVKQAMQVAPNDVGVLTAFGTLSLELGDTEAARSALRHLQAIEPDHSSSIQV